MSFVYQLFSISIFVAVISFFILKKNPSMADDTRKTLSTVFKSSAVVGGLSLAIAVAVPMATDDGTSDKRASESSSKASSESAKESSKAKASSEAESSRQKDQDEVAEAESIANKFRKEDRPKFTKKIQEMVVISRGQIIDISDDGTIITVTLSRFVIDNQDDSGLRQYCSSIYHNINDIASKYGQNPPAMRIKDEDGNLLAKTTLIGHDFKYYGMK